MAVDPKAEVLDEHGGQAWQHHPRGRDAAEVVDIRCLQARFRQGLLNGLFTELERPLSVLAQESLLILARYSILIWLRQNQMSTLNMAGFEHALDHWVCNPEQL